MTMEKRRIVSTPDAPAAIGPYSQAVVAGGFVFCSGQVALDPSTGELLGGTIAEQTRRCMDNLAAVLAAAGSSHDRVVKYTVFLADMGDFAEFNDAFSAYISSEPPARATVGVAALPKGGRIEIECVAESAP